MKVDTGLLLRERRKELGLTMKDIAKICDVSEPTVSRWERGETKNITRITLCILAETLHLPIEYIIGIDTDKPIESIEVIKKRQYLINLINKVKEEKKLDFLTEVIKKLLN